jgi:hypothetical protein
VVGRWDGTKFGNHGNKWPKGPPTGKFELKDQLICVLGNVAYEVGVECPEFKLGGEKVAGQIRVTNIYLREEDVRAQSCPATST